MLMSRLAARTLLGFALCAAATAPIARAQPKAKPVAEPAAVSVPTPDELNDVREQLVALVRMSPTLMQVVERDPSLLANDEYVSRSNPQLAQFLVQHPEVARNPEFYLFANFGGNGRRRVEPLRRAGDPRDPFSEIELRRRYIEDIMYTFIFVFIVGVLLWLIRLLLENRRWSRVFRQQTEIHSKLIDRFATNQELIEYMNTESGRRFLEASPIPIDPDRSHALPGGLARVIGPLQLGIVLTMLGFGLLIFHPLFIVGVIATMLGLGFIISAIVTWRLSARLGLMPQPASENRQ